MSTTNSYNCPAAQWTQVSSGSSSVIIQGPTYAFRVAVGTSAPASTATGITVNENDGVFSAQGLASTDNVFVTPTGTLTAAVQVIAS